MDFTTFAWLQTTLFLVVFLFLWGLKRGKSRNGNTQTQQLKTFGWKDWINLLYMLFETPKVVDGNKESRCQKVYKRFFSSTSGYMRGHQVLKVFGITFGFFATDHDTISEVYKSDAFNDKTYQSAMELYGGGQLSGIFMNNAKGHWSEIKRYTMKKLGQLGLGKRDFMTTLLFEQSNELLEGIEDVRNSSGNRIQVHGLFSASVLNVIISVAIGKTYSKDDLDFIRLHKCAYEVTDSHFLYIILYPLLKILPGGLQFFGLTRNLERFEQFRAMCLRLINERETLAQESNHSPRSFVDFFLQEIEKNKDDEASKMIFCKEQLITTVQDLVLAGIDTTSKFLESLVMFMCLYPEIQKRVQREIDEVIGKTAVHLYYEFKSKLPYTMATFYEVHRMANIVPTIVRMTSKDHTISGHHLKKGTHVIVWPFLARYEDTYWKNPCEFFPDRFLDENGDIVKEKVDRLLIFGTGIRVCPGENIAPATSLTFGTGFLQKYTVEQQDNSQILCMKEDFESVVGPEPFYVRIFER